MSDVMDNAKEAIKQVFNDDSVDNTVVRERLEELVEEIEVMLDSIGDVR